MEKAIFVGKKSERENIILADERKEEVDEKRIGRTKVVNKLSASIMNWG